MNKISILYVISIALCTNLLISSNNVFSLVQSNLEINDMNLKTNSLNLSEPVYQAITGEFLAAKDLSSTPFKVTEESFFEESVMKNVGNVTNNMTFTNTYLSPALIQAKGKGVIETKDGQAIYWISSDVGTINSTGFYFHGIILFNSTTSNNLSFLNNTIGIYKETPQINRTIWLMK